MEWLSPYLGEHEEFVFDYLVVNDGSFDNTRKICRDNGYRFLDLPINTGLTSGFRAGMKYAYSHGYDYVIQFDADGQHDPQYLLPMAQSALAEQADIVIGSRFVNAKKKLTMRMIGSNFLAAMINVTAHQKIADPTSGMRLYGRKLIERFAKDDEYSPEPDTVAFAIRQGAKVVEVPVTMAERFGGTSYLSAAKSAMYMMRMGLSILFFQWVRKA